MRKIIVKKITKEKLERYLAKIDWRIDHDWCHLNCVFINNHNEPTAFYLAGEVDIEIRLDNHKLFGSEYHGNLRLNLKDFQLEYVDSGSKTLNPMISLIIPKGNSVMKTESFISFYKK